MPSATPLPAGPSRLALFGAEDLLRAGGCPLCCYIAEAGDRFLGWFALEAHADADMITRLCGSLGFCAVHTRGMLGQPGAAGRMTALYTYLLRAAARYVAVGTSPSGPCLSCARDAEASDRAQDTLLTGLREADLRDRYRDSGGLCLPHLRAALPRAGNRLAAWLAGDMRRRLVAGPPSLALLAGDSDPDANVRARLRASLPAASPAALEGDVCAACQTMSLRERDAIGQLATAGGTLPGPCPKHLRDVCADGSSAPLIACQAERAQAWLASLMPAVSAGGAFRRLSAWRQRRHGGEERDGCPACVATGTMAWAHGARHAVSGAGQPPGLCLRHVLALRRSDPLGAAPLVLVAAGRTDSVLRELGEAFRKQSWAHRYEPRGREMTAWQRAAALVDGRVYGGGPTVPLSEFSNPGAWQGTGRWANSQRP